MHFCFKILFQVHAEWDIWWHDLWTFPLYTRGGPYWQEYRVPFSKFYFAHKGKIQDDQVRLSPILSILLDSVRGKFKLKGDPSAR